MHWPTLLLSAAALAEGKRSLQHVGKKDATPKSSRSDQASFLANYLATRQVPAPKFANENTTGAFPFSVRMISRI